MNVALLNKLKWRILKEAGAIWVRLLCIRYGNVKLKVIVGNDTMLMSKDSIWWRDLVTCDNRLPSIVSGFVGTVITTSGAGNDTALWHINWLGNQPLKGVFPESFVSATESVMNVAQVGAWDNRLWFGTSMLWWIG